MLVAAIILSIGIVSPWFICDSVLYEHAYDAQIDGCIMPVSSRVRGQVERVNVVEGQQVHAGDVLALIDQNEYRIAVGQALANLAYAEATTASLYLGAAITVASAYGGLNLAQAAVKGVQAEVAVAERKLRADEAVLEQIQGNTTRTSSDILRDRQYSSVPATTQEKEAAVNLLEAVIAQDQQGLQQAKGKLLEATTNLRNAQTAPQQVSLANANAQAADSEILERNAQLQQAQLNLSYTVIRSPITGVVGKRRVEVGQNVGVGQDLIDVVSLDDVWITANFNEKQLGRIRPGQPVEIKVDAYGRTWTGHVTNLGGGTGAVFSGMPPKNTLANAKVTPRVSVRIDFDRPESQAFNAEDLLKPGLSVEPKVRVRWVPRTRTPDTSPESRGSTVRPIAWWHRVLG